MMQKPLRKNPYLLLAGATLLFYLPVASLLFAIKNDMFTGYFPARFHLSTFLHEGMFPLWDPWINYGLPMYGDITATAWNPLTILIAGTFGYNAYTMTAEVLLALFTAGAAMHALCVRMGFEARTSFITALAYMACGYFIGDLQHLNWVWGAALLPWCAIGFLRFTDSGRWKDLPAALLPFFLFMAAAHPGLMIGAAYFFLLWTIARCLGIDHQERKNMDWAPLGRAFTLAAALLVVSFGLAYGYGYNLMLTTRAPGAIAAEATHGAFTFNSWISFLLPFSTTIPDNRLYGTDIAIRNGYIGILPLVMVLHAWLFQRNRWTIFWTIVIAFFLFISGGASLNSGFSRLLPLIGQVRLEGEFRIFAIFSALILSASVLHRPLRDIGGPTERIAMLFRASFGALTILALATAGLFLAAPRGILFMQGQSTLGIKGILHSFGFPETVLIQSLLQALLCFGLYRCFRKATIPMNRVMLLVVLDLTMSAWLNLPYTGVGSRSVSDMQTLIDRSPRGIPAVDTRPTRDIVSAYPATDSIIGNWSLYSKQMALGKKAAYPMTLSESMNFFPAMSDSLMNRPVLFMQNEEPFTDSITSWAPDHLSFITRHEGPVTVGLKQTMHPGWKASVDGRSTTVRSAWNGLISLDVPSGEHRVDLFFSDPLARAAQGFHFTIFLILVASAILFRRRERSMA